MLIKTAKVYFKTVNHFGGLDSLIRVPTFGVLLFYSTISSAGLGAFFCTTKQAFPKPPAW